MKNVLNIIHLPTSIFSLTARKTMNQNDVLAIFSFYIPWKHQKTRDFMVFSGSIKWEDQVLTIVNIPFNFNPCQFSILYPLKKQWNLRLSVSTKWKHWPETGKSTIFLLQRRCKYHSFVRVFQTPFPLFKASIPWASLLLPF